MRCLCVKHVKQVGISHYDTLIEARNARRILRFGSSALICFRLITIDCSGGFEVLNDSRNRQAMERKEEEVSGGPDSDRIDSHCLPGPEFRLLPISRRRLF